MASSVWTCREYVSDHPFCPHLVSVVIPALNASTTIEQQLQALSEQDFANDWEIVVADNGSTDGTPEIVRRWTAALPNLRLIDASDRIGASHARNVGVAHAKGDFLVTCDADDLVTPGWLSAMVRAAACCDVVAGHPDTSHFNPEEPLRPRGTWPGFLPYAPGSTCGVWRSVLDRIGGWDETYLRGAEDVEFSWRAQLHGYRLGRAEDAVVNYRLRSSLRGQVVRLYYLRIGAAHLYKDYRTKGMPRRSLWHAFKSWVWIILHTRDVFAAGASRRQWVVQLFYQLGNLRGSIRYRVMYF